MTGFIGDPASLALRLAAPFPPGVVSWRIGAMTKDDGKPRRGMALAYIDARDVQDRLDQVCGLFWQTRHHHCGAEKLACEIGIKIGDEWLWRGDGAGSTDVEAEKGAFSDSFKRAAVRWGIGRYLYDLSSPWIDLEAKGNSWVIPEHELARLRGMLTKSPAEPASVPVPTRPVNDGAAAPPPPATSVGSEKRQLKLSEIRDNILNHLENQTTALGVRTLRQLRQREIDMIGDAHQPTREMLEKMFDLKEMHLSPP